MNCFWTKSSARLQCIRPEENANFNWIFLPGGPGLGSEYLCSLTDLLKIPGNFWLLDLPGDGSNTQGSFENWSIALIEAVTELNNVILVAHSTGGMFALSTPQLEKHLKGLILLDSAPDASWQAAFAEEIEKNPLPNLDKLQANYRKNPNNTALKKLTIAFAPYLFTQEGQAKGKQLLENLPYNWKSCLWSEEHFDSTYAAKWIPKIPTLILSGEFDLITPLHLFSNLAEFRRGNITFQSIPNAGHFPWIENPEAVGVAFQTATHSFSAY